MCRGVYPLAVNIAPTSVRASSITWATRSAPGPAPAPRPTGGATCRRRGFAASDARRPRLVADGRTAPSRRSVPGRRRRPSRAPDRTPSVRDVGQQIRSFPHQLAAVAQLARVDHRDVASTSSIVEGAGAQLGRGGASSIRGSVTERPRPADRRPTRALAGRRRSPPYGTNGTPSSRHSATSASLANTMSAYSAPKRSEWPSPTNATGPGAR